MELQKLKIIGYENDPLGAGGGGGGETFEAQVNPEKFSFTRSLKANTRSQSGANSTSTQLQGYGQATLNMELHFDSTGVIKGKTDVEGYLQELQDVVYKYNGNKHKPKYLKVMWGKFVFYCHLKQMNIECSLFKMDGTVLRAKATLAFMEHVNNLQKTEESWNRSPDLTHLKTVRIGDNITQMCKDVYDDPKYYVEIAKANELVNFRNLRLGDQLLFPPLEK